MASKAQTDFDVAIIGGGPIACAIARDAVGRGLRVVLCAPGDLGGAVEQAIVDDALALGQIEDSSFESESNVMQRICPQLNLTKLPTPGKIPFLKRLFGQKKHRPCLVSPANAHRFSILNARDAAERGAILLPQTEVHSFAPREGQWVVKIGVIPETIRCKIIVDTLPKTDPDRPSQFARIALFDRVGDVPSFLDQMETEAHFCVEFCDNSAALGVVSSHNPGNDWLDVVSAKASFSHAPFWVSDSFLVNQSTHDGLQIDGDPPIFRISGVKSFEWRLFAENTVAEMAPYVRMIGKSWTDHTTLPGGDFQPSIGSQLLEDLEQSYPDVQAEDLSRLFKSYGTDCHAILDNSAGLGVLFGHGLFEAEVRWLLEKELARTADDIVWRRTLLGMHMEQAEVASLQKWVIANRH